MRANQASILPNMLVITCRTKCWIGLNTLKICEKKYHVRLRKIMLDENLSQKKFHLFIFLPHPSQFSCWNGLKGVLIQHCLTSDVSRIFAHIFERIE